MEKLKLNIKGIHCKSCSGLIENELNDHKGVTMSKVNNETGKAVIIFDENKTSSENIKKIIAKAGDYKAEDYDESEDNNDENKLKGNSAYLSIILTMIGIGILVVIFMLINQGKGGSNKTEVKKNNNNIANENKAAPTNPKVGSQVPAQGQIVDIPVSESDNIRGNIDAPITIVEYSDFQCPYCSRFHDTMTQVMAEYPEDVRWVYKHFPIDSIHPFARKTAEASECAAEQGKFWEFSDEVFANQQELSIAALSIFASSAGLDVSEFDACVASSKYADKVEADSQEGIQFGVTGTPGSFINGEALGGAVPYENLKQIIEELSQ
jgi:protein-disulfide isomerase/copper chaperone CopZ